MNLKNYAPALCVSGRKTTTLTRLHCDLVARQTEASPRDREDDNRVGAPAHQPSLVALRRRGVAVQRLAHSSRDDGGVVLRRSWHVPCQGELATTAGDAGGHILWTARH